MSSDLISEYLASQAAAGANTQMIERSRDVLETLHAALPLGVAFASRDDAVSGLHQLANGSPAARRVVDGFYTWAAASGLLLADPMHRCPRCDGPAVGMSDRKGMYRAPLCQPCRTRLGHTSITQDGARLWLPWLRCSEERRREIADIYGIDLDAT
jgi:hypothetical protein